MAASGAGGLAGGGSAGDSGCAKDPCGCDGRCPDEGWTAPILLEEEDGKHFADPSIGVDDRGNVVVAWERDVDEAGGVWVNTYDASRGMWRGAFDLLGGDFYSQTSEPIVAFGPGAEALVFLRYQPTSSNSTREMRVYRFAPDSNQWTFTPLTTPGKGGWRLRVAQNASGQAAVHYWSGSSMVSYYDPETKVWNSWRTLGIADHSQHAHIAVSPSGQVTYVWRDITEANFGMFAQSYDPATGWGEIALLDQGAEPTHMVIDGNEDGLVVASWRRRLTAADPYAVEVSIRNPDTGKWSPHSTVSEAGENVENYWLSVDGEGNLIFAWTAYLGDGRVVKVRRYDQSSQTWSEATTIHTEDPEGWNGGMHAAADGSGNAVVMWESEGPAQVGHVRAAYYEAAEDRWTRSVRIDAEPGDVLDRRLTMGVDGTAYAVWTQAVERKKSIWLATRPAR